LIFPFKEKEVLEMEKPIQVMKRRVHVIGHSRLVVLPKWWIGEVDEVEIEVFPDKIVIKKEVRK